MTTWAAHVATAAAAVPARAEIRVAAGDLMAIGCGCRHRVPATEAEIRTSAHWQRAHAESDARKVN
jgi:hypothetical protein